MRVPVTVTVSGPGGTFGDIIAIIRTALDNAGVDVVVTDEYPPDVRHDKLVKSAEGRSVDLVAKHAPWGG